MAHLDNTPVKITLGLFVQEAPECRADLIKHLQLCNKATSNPADTRTPATKRAAEPSHEPPANPRPFAPARPVVVDQGPVPMETTLETEAFYHNQSATTNAVVRAEVNVLGKAFEGIIDTGASNTLLSHSVVRRLGLMDGLVPSRISFLTAAGNTEQPIGMLIDLPITIGSLCLHIDCMVTKANKYNVVFGNDWLRLAGSDLLLSQGVLRNRLAPDQYKEVQIDTTRDHPKVNLMQPKDPRGVRTAVQCLEQSQPILHTTQTSGASDLLPDLDSDIPDLLTDSDSDIPDLLTDTESDSGVLADTYTAAPAQWSFDSESDDEGCYLPVTSRRCVALCAPANAASDSSDAMSSDGNTDSDDTTSSSPETPASSICNDYATFAIEPQAVGLPALAITTAAHSGNSFEVDPETDPGLRLTLKKTLETVLRTPVTT